MLLLCGIDPNASELLVRLYAVRPEIALQAILEIDPVNLDLHLALEIVNSFCNALKPGDFWRDATETVNIASRFLAARLDDRW